MGEIHNGIGCKKPAVGHLPPDSKGRVSKQSTEIVGETTMMQKNLLWAFSSSGGLVEIILGKVSILMDPCSFKTTNRHPHSKNLEVILKGIFKFCIHHCSSSLEFLFRLTFL